MSCEESKLPRRLPPTWPSPEMLSTFPLDNKPFSPSPSNNLIFQTLRYNLIYITSILCESIFMKKKFIDSFTCYLRFGVDFYWIQSFGSVTLLLGENGHFSTFVPVKEKWYFFHINFHFMLIKNLIYFPPFLIIILANIIFKIFKIFIL